MCEFEKERSHWFKSVDIVDDDESALSQHELERLQFYKQGRSIEGTLATVSMLHRLIR